MPTNGFYAVEFSAVVQGAGGIVVLEDGNIRGGDSEYLYSGTYSGQDGRLSAQITVKAHSPKAVSVFNTIGGKFKLDLVGNVVGDGFQASGNAPVPGAPGITIRARKLDDLAL
ncbi:type III secretion system (T3SS) negative regulator GrlR [Paraburkholderia sp. BL6669N2]|uniref:GrlR family regulatory protein n=1 Tax=Paraburkholderia sp. BL6669N2 TaxID=1938807 RepID=UPI000E37C8D8|nr:GrlR family regulatory protein [Paraburkholderia sp. BL6669N2]REG61547.1 type III secretion system (T3SS) negative regulator GrlR [Paraburkholderia sp. BL6669N2]